jgi:transketolase
MTAISFVSPAEIERIRAGITDRHRRCRALADASRLNTLSMIMCAGSGHIGSSFSTMDLLCWLWTEELKNPVAQARSDADGDTYFSSKGHDVPGLYAALIGLGRLDASYLTKLRRLNGLPGHPDVSIPYMITNTGPLGMGISKARGMATANRLDGKRGRFFVLMGDGELQEGQFWESLQPTANGGFSEITVIVDHNKMQSDTFVSSVSDLGNLEAKIRAFGWEVARCDGHDCAAIEAALGSLSKAGKRPRLLIADTIKGKGVSFMQSTAVDPAVDKEALYKFHSGAPSPEHYVLGVQELSRSVDAALAEAGKAPLKLQEVAFPARYVPESPERLVNAYAEELVALGRKHPEIVALDGDLMVDCGALPFKREFPERFIECGIAEQDMVSQAGALALKGKLPVVHSFACFLSTRPNEQIYNNATEGTRVIYHASLAGLLPAAPGHSHQSVRDISAVGSVPNLTLIQPCNEQETRLALRWAVEENAGSTYLRLVTVPCAVPYRLPEGHRLELGRGTQLKAGRAGVIIAYGPVMLAQAFEAASLLQERGQALAVINLPWLNRVDGDWLARALHGQPRLFLVEDHYPQLGQSAVIAQALLERGIALPTRVYGVAEIPACGQILEVLEHHGLSAARLAERIAAEL